MKLAWVFIFLLVCVVVFVMSLFSSSRKIPPKEMELVVPDLRSTFLSVLFAASTKTEADLAYLSEICSQEVFSFLRIATVKIPTAIISIEAKEEGSTIHAVFHSRLSDRKLIDTWVFAWTLKKKLMVIKILNLNITKSEVGKVI